MPARSLYRAMPKWLRTIELAFLLPVFVMGIALLVRGQHEFDVDDIIDGGGAEYKILVLSPLCSKSHIIAYTPLLNELAERGHHVTALVSYHVPSINQRVEVLTDEEVQKLAWGIFQWQFPDTIGTTWQAIQDELAFSELSIEACPGLLATPSVQRLKDRVLHGKEAFDFVLITSHMSNECMFGFVNKVKAPFGYLFSAGDQPWSSAATGNPAPTSFVPYIATPYGDRMSFWERVVNTLLTLVMARERRRVYEAVEPLVRKEFQLTEADPSIGELEKNVSLVLLNEDQRLFQYPAPSMPSVIGISGAHCRPARSLPQDLQEWMTRDEAGVIYFSMGSAVSSNNFPEEKRKAFSKAFREIRAKYGFKVLWKWDGEIDEQLADDSNGFRVQKWAPQQDLLGHEKLKLFITHGGLLSCQETTFHGVPVLGIPIGADQMMNLKRISDWGAGRMLLWRHITAERLVKEMSEILNDQRYAQAAKERASIMTDRQQSPEKLGAYWIEYVARHDGAGHLKSHGRLLQWYQYHLVDVCAFLLLIFVSCLILIGITARYCFKLLFKKQTRPAAVPSLEKKAK